MPRPVQPDWTTGPAKWAAVVLLGIASATGMTWSMVRSSDASRAPATPVSTPAPAAFLELPAQSPPSPASPERLTRRINVNTATAAELELLPGVGPAMAQRIIEFRTTRGPFKRLEDLDGVKGIGPRTLDKLRDLVAVQ